MREERLGGRQINSQGTGGRMKWYVCGLDMVTLRLFQQEKISRVAVGGYNFVYKTTGKSLIREPLPVYLSSAVSVLGCDTWVALQLWHTGSAVAPWNVGSQFPDLGVKPVSPALEGRFLANGPPEKSQEPLTFQVLYFELLP